MSQLERSAGARFFARLALLPIVVLLALIDQNRKGSLGFAIYEYLQALWYTFLYLLAAVSLIVAGVSASGRLKSGPDPKTTKPERVYDIRGSTMLILLIYMAVYGAVYLSEAKIAGFSLADLTPFSNIVLFAAPVWIATCVLMYRSESEEDAT